MDPIVSIITVVNGRFPGFILKSGYALVLYAKPLPYNCRQVTQFLIMPLVKEYALGT